MGRSSVRAGGYNSFWRQLDYWLLVPVLCICTIGLFTLNKVLRNNFPSGYPRNIIIQVVSVLIGLVLLFIIVRMGVDFLPKIGWIMYGVAIVLQALLPIFGDKDIAAVTGSNSWLEIPVIGSIQPSEFSKVALAILVPIILQKIKIRDYSYLKGFGLILLLTAPHFLLILGYQNDFGTALVLVILLAAMIFVWGIRIRYVILILSLFIIAFPFAWLFYFEDFQKIRFLSFLYPGFDPQASYNVDQAKKAIALGGLTGNRTGEFISVPVQESDFIFSAVAEMMGFVGAAALIILIFIYLIRGLYIASNAMSPQEQYMATGISTVFAFHSVENIGMCMGLFPVTGIPLPFVSQGGSAMVANFISLAVLITISSHRRRRT
ncbi:MAG: FtsW/RodA/SpoVE family cell cycle protein [Clostridiaceae bacterium]|jgi:rod shape determining protein RodA|nr:FtsW/RodA/SpoVE family cell cycle protein [Clostridiaceae bacterium]